MTKEQFAGWARLWWAGPFKGESAKEIAKFDAKAAELYERHLEASYALVTYLRGRFDGK